MLAPNTMLYTVDSRSLKKATRFVVAYWCRANWIQVYPASLELGRLLLYTEGCSDRWSRHVLPKFKSEINEDSPNYSLWERMSHVYLVRAF